MTATMTGKIPLKLFLPFCFIWILFLNGSDALATEIYIEGIKAKPGQTIEMPIMIDKIDNLAGMKLVLRYDDALLTYKKSSKTKYSSSLMHIVNDKRPGVLIIVMAGACGDPGEEFPASAIFFPVKNKDYRGTQSTVKIT